MIAALFVETNGQYFGLDNVIPWDEDKDARLYSGDYPVVAHPPCQRWGRMALVNHKRWGVKPFEDDGCFESALASVKRYGGVLEHPQTSYAWKKFGIDKPQKGTWVKSGVGWVCVVWQSAYGHLANKATTLYYVGNRKPFDLNWDRPKGMCQIGFQDRRGKSRNKPTLNKRRANATPILFRDTLLDLARYSLI